MCKILVSLLMLVALVSLSKSNGVVPVDLVADTFQGLATPVGAVVGGVAGLLAEGPSGIETGSKGPPKTIAMLADNIRNSKNKSTTGQLSSVVGSGAGFVLAPIGGALTSIPQQNVTAGIANAQKGAQTGMKLGDKLGETLNII